MDDLISRQAAIDAVNELTYPSSLVDVKRKLLQLPSADRPSGEWLARDCVFGVVYCSECGYELRQNDTNYCPNCGARMKGSGE